MDHHAVLQEKLRKAFGGKVPLEARDSWAEFLKTRGTEIYVKYDWIKDNRLYDWLSSQVAWLDFGEGVAGITIFVHNDKYDCSQQL